MEKITLSKGVQTIESIITPPNQKVESSQIKFTTYSLAEGLLKAINNENTLPKDYFNEIGYLFAISIINGSMCFGIPQKYLDKVNTIANSYSTLIYYRCIDMFLSETIPFMEYLHNVTMETIQGTKTNDDFQKVINSFIDYFTVIQCMAEIIIYDIQNLPDDFKISIKDQINEQTDQILKCFRGYDELRALKEAKLERKPSIDYSVELKILHENHSKLHQIISIIQNKIIDNFSVIFCEQPFIEWQLYCLKIADTLAMITFITFKIASYDPTKLVQTIQSLQQIQILSYLTISPLLIFFRNRMELETACKISKTAHLKLIESIPSLLSLIISIIPSCPPPFDNFFKDKIYNFFKEIQNLNGEYDDRISKLLKSITQNFGFYNIYAFLSLIYFS